MAEMISSRLGGVSASLLGKKIFEIKFIKNKNTTRSPLQESGGICVCLFVSSSGRRRTVCERVRGPKTQNQKQQKATWICPLVCFNAPELPGGMNLWLSPAGRSRHSHLLSNLLKNGPERKKQKEPFRLKTFAGRKCVCLREEKWSKSFVSGEKQINTFVQPDSSQSQRECLNYL